MSDSSTLPILEALMRLLRPESNRSGVVTWRTRDQRAALCLLADAGLATKATGDDFRLLWDVLAARKTKQPGAWHECVTNPADVEQLLSKAP